MSQGTMTSAPASNTGTGLDCADQKMFRNYRQGILFPQGIPDRGGQRNSFDTTKRWARNFAAGRVGTDKSNLDIILQVES